MSAKTGNRREIIAWALYDFANSPFTTLVVTFIFATYFTEVIAPSKIEGTALWSRGVTITAVVVALLSPFMGALADRGGWRKSMLLTTTLICAGGSVGLFFAGPGHVLMALSFFVVANIAFEMGMVFYNAFLPDITNSENIGKVSGGGWALGYFGGLLALLIAYFGFVETDNPMFGFSKEGGEAIRATNLLVAGWFLLFSIPLFLWVRGGAAQQRESQKGLIRDSLHQLAKTAVEIKRYRQILRFLVARLIYNDGLVTVFAFGGIYAAGTFGFETKEILIFGIVLNVTAGLGALAMGFLDDRFGGKATLLVSIAGLVIATLLAILAPGKTLFWVAGILVGIFSGPNQSASRSLMGRFVPPDKENEFFGFFAFSGKATAFMGPFLLGIFTSLFDSQRAGMAVVIILLLGGGVVLLSVDEAEGQRAAKEPALD